MSSLIIISTQVGFFHVGKWIFESKLLQKGESGEVESVDLMIKNIFNITMSSSLALLELLILELLDIFPRSTRLFFWKVNLIVLLLLLIFIVPFFQLKLSISNRFGKNNFFKVLILSFIVYFWLFYKLGSLFPSITTKLQPSRSSYLFSIEEGIGRIGIIGITMLALISGYGSVIGPVSYTFIKNVSNENLESAESQFIHAQSTLEQKRRQFQLNCERKISNRNEVGSSNDISVSWLFKRVSAVFNSNEDENLAEEISNLELVVSNLKSNFDELQFEHQKHVFSKTFKGKILNVLGHFLSIYCVYRIFSSFLNIIMGRIGQADPVTIGLGFFVHIFNVDWDVQLKAKEISFLFVGGVLICSIRNFLLEFLKIFKIIDRFAYSRAFTLFSSQLIGLYVTSTLLMLRLNLPINSRPILTQLLGDIQFDFFERWFDSIYLFSALSSIVYVYTIRNHYFR